MADSADALYSEALSACEQGRIEDGVAILNRARVLAPDQARIHGLLGKALVHLGRNEDALARGETTPAGEGGSQAWERDGDWWKDDTEGKG